MISPNIQGNTMPNFHNNYQSHNGRKFNHGTDTENMKESQINNDYAHYNDFSEDRLERIFGGMYLKHDPDNPSQRKYNSFQFTLGIPDIKLKQYNNNPEHNRETKVFNRKQINFGAKKLHEVYQDFKHSDKVKDWNATHPNLHLRSNVPSLDNFVGNFEHTITKRGNYHPHLHLYSFPTNKECNKLNITNTMKVYQNAWYQSCIRVIGKHPNPQIWDVSDKYGNPHDIFHLGREDMFCGDPGYIRTNKYTDTFSHVKGSPEQNIKFNTGVVHNSRPLKNNEDIDGILDIVHGQGREFSKYYRNETQYRKLSLINPEKAKDYPIPHKASYDALNSVIFNGMKRNPKYNRHEIHGKDIKDVAKQVEDGKMNWLPTMAYNWQVKYPGHTCLKENDQIIMKPYDPHFNQLRASLKHKVIGNLVKHGEYNRNSKYNAPLQLQIQRTTDTKVNAYVKAHHLTQLSQKQPNPTPENALAEPSYNVMPNSPTRYSTNHGFEQGEQYPTKVESTQKPFQQVQHQPKQNNTQNKQNKAKPKANHKTSLIYSLQHGMNSKNFRKNKARLKGHTPKVKKIHKIKRINNNPQVIHPSHLKEIKPTNLNSFT